MTWEATVRLADVLAALERGNGSTADAELFAECRRAFVGETSQFETERQPASLISHRMSIRVRHAGTQGCTFRGDEEALAALDALGDARVVFVMTDHEDVMYQVFLLDADRSLVGVIAMTQPQEDAARTTSDSPSRDEAASRAWEPPGQRDRRDLMLEAADSTDAVEALRDVVKQLLADGVAPEAVLDDLDDIRTLVPDEDKVMDVMDLLVGWCAPSARLVDPPLFDRSRNRPPSP